MRSVFIAFIFLLFAQGSFAQETTGRVAMVADSVQFDQSSGLLTAIGNVRILYKGGVLTTDRVIYNQTTKQISVPAPLKAVLDDGDTIIAAQSAELSDDLAQALIKGAQVLLNDQFQLVAADYRRVNDRYNVLSRTTASTCYICENTQTPFWQIRSSRTVHDELENQIYFENAALFLLGFPVLYTPYLRTPDPTLNRARGFLAPRFSTSNTLGYGYRQEYFIPIGDHADLTLAPYITSKGGAVLESQYRQVFKNGKIEFNGQFLVIDDIYNDKFRSSLTGEGHFDLPREFELDFGIDIASDDLFRAQYGYGNQDRLTSFLRVQRTGRTSYFAVETSAIQSLRGVNEVDQEIPLILPEITYSRSWSDPLLNGRFTLSGDTFALLRGHNQESLRLAVTADWRKTWELPKGFLLDTTAELAHRIYVTNNDPILGSDRFSSTTPTLAAKLSWPLMKTTGPVRHVLEPVVHVAWSPNTTSITPNEDSQQVQFEEGNLFALTRFPGEDRKELGGRASIGLNYWRYSPTGWNIGATVGQVFRTQAQSEFAPVSGLSGTSSDILAAFTLQYNDSFTLHNRSVFDLDFNITKNETQVLWSRDRFDIGARYLWIEDVPGTDPERNELSVNAAYNLNEYWTAMAEFSQDLDTGTTTDGELNLIYQNECIKVNLSLSLQNATSANVNTTKEFGLSVELAGLGGKRRNNKFAHRCDAL